MGEEAGEHLLGQVLSSMQVTGEAGAETADRFLPAVDEAGERAVVIRRLHAPHELFVRGSEQGLQRLKGARGHGIGVKFEVRGPKSEGSPMSEVRRGDPGGHGWRVRGQATGIANSQ